MRSFSARLAVLVPCTLLGLGLGSGEARADSAGLDPVVAAKEVRDGDRAFDRRDYRRAAEVYESAFEHSRSPAVLVKAARAWWKVQEHARAANDLEDYLAITPQAAPARTAADHALKKLAESLGRIELDGASADLDRITLDGAPLKRRSSYVSTGAHVVEAQTKERELLRAWANVGAGETAKIALVTSVAAAPSPATPTPPKPAPRVAAPSASERDPRRPLPAAAVIAGGVVTAGLAGTAIWSGLDTESFRDEFDKAPTQSNLDEGSGKQLRTNVLLGATAGVGALTALAAIFFVDWKGQRKETSPSTSPQLTFGAGSAVVSGRF